ncbi:hypothetical protein DFH08DRAFT_911690 [Mycena albidolilacea]|uniref:DDE Tnp4 domain-containing protein n=1 Tax=Mycena albidolilacea TaxID=1033008 RepID=A0AAD7EYK5_9AGAR|nr:hypothetical protein DFH08DRAFT_911690 [Mycena albidolilacea]
MVGDGSRGPYNLIIKSADFFSVCLQAPNRQFCHMFRIGRDMSDWLVGILAHNPIFQPHRGRPQCHVKYQLGCFLIRYGAIGSDTLGTAQKLSIRFGTVFLYCKRVRRALRELRSQFVGWPSSARKLAIKTHIKDVSGFSRCLGAGDRSLINFDETPIHEGPPLYVPKETNIQATCDHEKRFTSFELGWPGSVTDRHFYFENGEYILVDKGYSSSPFTVRPFDEPEIAAASDADKERIGPSICAFPLFESTIEALMVIHNMAIDFGDHPSDEWRLDENPDDQDDENNGNDEPLVSDVVGEAQVPAYETDDFLKEQGRRKRLALLDRLF